MASQPLRVVQQAEERTLLVVDDQEINSRAREAVTFARENASEREAVVDQRKVVVDALRRNLGLTTYDAVIDEFNKRIENGDFIRVAGICFSREIDDFANRGDGAEQYKYDRRRQKNPNRHLCRGADLAHLSMRSQRSRESSSMRVNVKQLK